MASNDSTATAGVLFNTLGAPLASAQNTGNNCFNSATGCGTVSLPQPAGAVSIQNSAVLVANIGLLTTPVVCPTGHYAGTAASNGTCVNFSYPLLNGNIFWQNASFQVGVGSLSNTFQQNVITLYNSSFPGTVGTHGSAIASQASTGQCVSGSSYWDIGVRGDTGPANHTAGITLNPTYSILTSTAGYASTNAATAPNFIRQYCDGARQPPESGASGWAVPPGISDATVPNPIFNLTPVATVDEGNNWVNLRWGPLTQDAPLAIAVGTQPAVAAGGQLGNYSLTAANDRVPTTQPHSSTDFFGNLRPEPAVIDTTVDAGAVEFGSAPATQRHHAVARLADVLDASVEQRDVADDHGYRHRQPEPDQHPRDLHAGGVRNRDRVLSDRWQLRDEQHDGRSDGQRDRHGHLHDPGVLPCAGDRRHHGRHLDRDGDPGWRDRDGHADRDAERHGYGSHRESGLDSEPVHVPERGARGHDRTVADPHADEHGRNDYHDHDIRRFGSRVVG